MYLEFLSLASGSSGNCYYLGDSTGGILIDAGIAVRTIKKGLKDAGIAFEKILGILITHDHFDHIKSAGVLGEKYNIPVYSTEAVLQGINKNLRTGEKIYGSGRTIEKETPFRLSDFTITAFDVPHDGTDNVGYHISRKNIQIVFATDLGHIPDNAGNYLRSADYLILESNYDDEMLKHSRYHYSLRARISGDNGHLGNKQTAEFLAENYTPRLKHVFLCHLSKENNHPELVYKTIELRLAQNNIIVGKDLQITVLKRNMPTGVVILE
ncbi:MAG: MBL fold metallo-hydrolase [Candidatus Azobacteroides sp.]|nr:MBL fold metallo-hydrolase [Candidatus Azobacteroides sp.]